MDNEPPASTDGPARTDARRTSSAAAPRSSAACWSSSLFTATVALLLSAAAAQIFVYEPVQRALAAAQLRLATQAVDADFAALFQRIETIARLRADWGQAGLINADDERGLVRLMAPVLMNEPDVSSVAIAQTTGREMLLRKARGQFLHPAADRSRRHARRGGRHALDARRPEPGPELRTSSDYDARQRPWFKQAMAVGDKRRVVWTDPFVFRSTGMPGMSARGPLDRPGRARLRQHDRHHACWTCRASPAGIP